MVVTVVSKDAMLDQLGEQQIPDGEDALDHIPLKSVLVG